MGNNTGKTLRVAGVSLVVEGAEKFKQDMKAASQAQEDALAAMRRLEAEQGKTPTNAQGMEKRRDTLIKQLEAQRMRTQALKETMEEAARQDKLSADQRQKLERAIYKSETAEKALERQINETTAAIDDMTEAMQKAPTVSERMDSGLDSLAKKSEAAAQKVKMVSVAAAGLATLSVKSALEFEDSLYIMATMPDVATEKLGELSDGLLRASDATGVAAKELSEAAYEAVSSGVAVEHSVGFTTNAAKAAKAGLTDTATAVDGASSAMNAWGIATDKSADVFGKFLIAQNEGKVTLGEIAQSIGQVTGVAPQLNVSLDEVLAATAALTKAGVPASQSMNGLKAVFSNILKPTKEASDEARRLGLEFSVAGIKSKGFTGFLSEVMTKTGGSEESLAKLFGSVEGLSRIMALGTTANADYTAALGKMSQSGGVLDEMFGTRMQSKAQRLQLSVNKLKNAGIELGDAYSPVVDRVSDVLGSVSDWARNADEGTVRFTAGLVGVAAVSAPALKAVSGMATGAKTLMSLMSGPTGWILLGVAGLSALGVALYKATDTAGRMRDTFAAVKLGVSDESVNAIKSGIEKGMETADASFDARANIIADTDALKEQLDSMFDEDSDKGSKLSRKEYKAISKFVDETVQADIDRAKAKMETQKEDFKTSLLAIVDDDGQSVFSEDRAEELATGLSEKTAKLISELEGYKEDYVALAKEIYRDGRTPTEDEIENLNLLLDKIGEVRIELNEAQDAATQVLRARYRRVLDGKGTEDDLGSAIGYVDTAADRRLLEMKRKRERDIAAYGETIDTYKALIETGKLTADEMKDALKAIADAEAEQDKLLDGAGDDDAQVLLEKQEALQALFDGMAKTAPDAAAKLEEVAALYDSYGKLVSAMEMPDATIPDIAAQFGTKEYLDKFLPNVTEADVQAAIDANDLDWLGAMVTELESKMQQKMTDAATGLTDNPVFSWLQATLDQGALETLDVTAVDGTLEAAIKSLDLLQRGTDIGKDIVSGVSAGIGTGADELSASDAELVALRNAIIDTIRTALDSHSPARVVMPVGEDVTGGIVAGMNSGRALSAIRSGAGLIQMAISSELQGTGAIGYIAGKALSDELARAINEGRGKVLYEARRLRDDLRDVLSRAGRIELIIGRRDADASDAAAMPRGDVYNSAQTTVTIQRATLDNEQSVKELARELGAYQSRALAGIGL